MGLKQMPAAFNGGKIKANLTTPPANSHSEPEDPLHFIAKCPALSPVRSHLSAAPEAIKPHRPDPDADLLRFTEVVLGLEWIKDTPTETFIIDFLTQLKRARNSLILQLD